MNRLFNILLVVVGAALVNLACSREDAPEGSVPDYTRVELALDMGAMTRATGEEANNTIEDVTVWAYEVESGEGASAVVKETPSGWATRRYDGGTSPLSLYIELPYDAYNAHTYRFVAVLNKERFGDIYKPESNTPQPLEERTRYTDLTHAVFQTDELIGYTADETGTAPTADSAVPMSHWKDVEIGAGVKDLTGVNAKEITVYRALAKTQFSARLHKDSSPNAALKITSVTVHSASGGASAYKIARQGFLVSALSTDDHEEPNPLPKAFGGYRDLATEVPKIGLINTDAEAPSKALDVMVSNQQDTLVGSTFLYENHHSMANINSASTTSHADYTAGIYYMKVEYEYGANSEGDDDKDGDGIKDDTKKEGVNYVPLPSIVRNRDYRVKATFDVQLAGVVNLGYKIEDWEDGGTDVLDFTYPTFTVEAVATYDHDDVPYYGKPTAYHDNAQPEDGAFAFRFQATSPLNKDYTVTAVDTPDGTFEVAIYKNGTDKLNTTSFTVTNANDYYIIKVYPTASMPQDAPAPSCRVAITHTASWTNVTSGLLINTTTGGTRWADSGDDRHSIVVTQVAPPTPAQ